MERKLQMRAMKDTVAGWISSEQQQPGQLSWGGGEGGTQYMCVGWGCFLFFLGVWGGWGQRIVIISWGQSKETGARIANQNITSAAPALRQSHRAVKRRQCQWESLQHKKGQALHSTPYINFCYTQKQNAAHLLTTNWHRLKCYMWKTARHMMYEQRFWDLFQIKKFNCAQLLVVVTC